MRTVKAFVRKLNAMIDRIAYALALVAVASAILLTVVITYGVIMRFVFSSSQYWADEFATYCLLWMTFLGLPYTLLSGSHIRIDFFSGLLPPQARHALEIGCWLIGAAFAGLLLAGSITVVRNFVRRDTQSVAGLDIPLYWPASALVIGSAMFGLAMLARTMHLAVWREQPKPPNDPLEHP